MKEYVQCKGEVSLISSLSPLRFTDVKITKKTTYSELTILLYTSLKSLRAES